MKFTKEKVSTLDGFTEYTQTEIFDPPIDNPFTATTSRLGVLFKGHSSCISTVQDLQAFAQMLDRAWRMYADLKPPIYDTLGKAYSALDTGAH